MNRRLVNQIKLLKQVDIKTIFENKFLLYFDKNFEIYYAPLEYVNYKAKIVMVNLSPDINEMLESFKLANKGVSPKKIKDELISQKNINLNLTKFLDKLNINHLFNIKSCESLFNKNKKLLHITSIIKFPTFYKSKKYLEINLFKQKVLVDFIEKYFLKELKIFKDCIIIPLSTDVSSIIENLDNKYNLKLNFFLKQFPNFLNKNNLSNNSVDQIKMMNLIKKIK